jgi:hypothetical protein
LALVIPAALTAAGRLPGIHVGSAVAAISAIGRIGFVAGPPLIGHIAEAVTLPVALGVLPNHDWRDRANRPHDASLRSRPGAEA